MLSAWLPDGLPLLSALLLVLVAGFTSWLTAGLGIGGGVLLLAVMSLLVPAPALIALHGVVQIGANIGRTALMRQHVDTGLLLPFGVGALLGALVGGQLFVQLPTRWLDLALGLFILYATWGHWPSLRRTGLWISSTVISFLSMFVGATGPLVTAALKSQALARQAHVATFSACMSLQHGLKVAMFGFLGFQFGPWLALLTAMVLSGLVGTWLGERWLARRSDQAFHHWLAWLLTAMALHLLWRAVMAG